MHTYHFFIRNIFRILTVKINNFHKDWTYITVCISSVDRIWLQCLTFLFQISGPTPFSCNANDRHIPFFLLWIIPVLHSSTILTINGTAIFNINHCDEKTNPHRNSRFGTLEIPFLFPTDVHSAWEFPSNLYQNLPFLCFLVGYFSSILKIEYKNTFLLFFEAKMFIILG